MGESMNTNDETSANKTAYMNTNSNSSNSKNVNSSLRAIYRQLKPPVISQRVYDDLTVCIVFQIILFLANEHVSLISNHNSNIA
jgi:hypothetical protein